MENQLKRKVANGEKCLGIFHELMSAAAARCLAVGGMDFIIVDTEHGPGDVESTMASITALNGYSTTALVRVKEISRAAVLKMLDIGAQGLVVPCVESVQQVRELVSYAKYYPIGSRGYAPAIGSDFGYADFAKSIEAQFEHCNRESLLFPQCETLGCLENIEEITAMEGVDGIFIGPYDLSIALGKPGQMDSPELKAAIERILAACKANGKISLIYAGGPERAKALFRQGFDCVACGMDAISLVEACRQLSSQAKE